jgi:hypothetical protein
MLNTPADNHKKMRSYLIGGSVVAGLLVGIQIDWTRQSGVLHLASMIQCVLLAVCSYLIPTLLLLSLNKHHRSKIPEWIISAFLGTSISYLSIVQIPNEISAWQFRKGMPLLEYILARLPDQTLNYIFFCIFEGIPALLIIWMAYRVGRKSILA